MKENKYEKLEGTVNPPILKKIFYGYPDKLEMKDEDGKLHTYSIVEILDGLTALARKLKGEKK